MIVHRPSSIVSLWRIHKQIEYLPSFRLSLATQVYKFGLSEACPRAAGVEIGYSIILNSRVICAAQEGVGFGEVVAEAGYVGRCFDGAFERGQRVGGLAALQHGPANRIERRRVAWVARQRFFS